MGGTKTVEAPPPRDYAAETRANQQAQIDLAPATYAAEASEAFGQPAYTRLGLRNQQVALEGYEGQAGMLDQMEHTVLPSLRRSDAANLRYQRGEDISDVETYGARAFAAIEGADPQSRALGNELTSQVQGDLASQGALSQPERRRYQQDVRGSFAARGLQHSPSAGTEEAYALHMGRDAKRQRAQQNASQLWSQRRSQGDPFMSVLGRGSNTGAAGQSFMQGGQALVAGSGPGLFNPESGYAQQMHNQNYQAQMSARAASASNRSALWGAGIGAVGSIFKGMCHVAREVYGEDNPRWIQFFIWKEHVGPKWFAKLYNKYSERVAKFISDKPRLKAVIRNWMESKIGRL